MLEIITNLYGEITLKESDEAKGIGTIWNFKVLQDFIDEEKTPRDIVPHLVRLMLKEVEDISFTKLSKVEKDRLEKELTRVIYKIYYPSNDREFRVEYADGYFRFYEKDVFLRSTTVKQYANDLEDECKPTKKNQEPKTKEEVTVSFLNNILVGKNFSKSEMQKLCESLFEAYALYLDEMEVYNEKMTKINNKKKK